MIYYIIIPLLEAIVIIRFASVFIISMVLILKSNQYSLSVDIFSQIYFSIHSVCNTYCTMYNVQCTMYNVQCTMYNVHVPSYTSTSSQL